MQADIKKQVQRINEKLDLLEKKIQELKTELNNVKCMQLTYYNSLLYEGLDVRSEGLIWIIKAIWALGYNVNLSKFPTFLDALSVEYLFQVLLILPLTPLASQTRH